MFTNIYGCNVYPPLPVQSAFQREQCQHPRAGGVGAAIFFIVFLVFGSLVLITLFVGVVTTSMDESQKHSKVEIDLEKRVEDVCETTHVGGELLAVYRRVFKMLDLDSSGTISLKELQICMRAVRIDVEEVALRAWVKEVDINNDGEVDIVEFILVSAMFDEPSLPSPSFSHCQRHLWALHIVQRLIVVHGTLIYMCM